jgi:Cof subfamily protein (haloacid dehalogenase superfamily)
LKTTHTLSSDNPSFKEISTEPFKGLFITDLDGTLLDSDRTMSDRDRRTLTDLGEKGIVRAIATGRSLYSFERTEGLAIPIDYVIFSTGAGILRVSDKKLLRGINLDTDAVSRVTDVLKQTSLDFMVHRPVPDNHRFAYWGSVDDNPDFAKRIALYKEVSWPLDGEKDGFGPAAQLLAVLPPTGDIRVIERLQKRLPDLNVIRATSPLDGGSTWIEFFHKSVSKSSAAGWLARHLDISRNNTLSVGNDYNDQDLLEWTGMSFVVKNAPDALKKRFPAVSSHNRSGVTEAVEKWLSARSIEQRA